MTDFVMPSLGADMEQGKLLEWLVKPGDEVHRGDIVAVVDTAKAAVEVEVFTDGVVEDLLVDVGATVPVGAPLAHISESSAPSPTVEPSAVSAASAASSSASSSSAVGHTHEHEVAPLARRMAADLGIDADSLPGTGLHGRVTRDDVVRAAAEAHPPEAAVAAAVAPRRPAAPPAASSGVAIGQPTGLVTGLATGRVTGLPGGAIAQADGPPATPYARRRAGELGLDLEDVAALITGGQLHPSRADGVLAGEDVDHAADHTGDSGPPPSEATTATATEATTGTATEPTTTTAGRDPTSTEQASRAPLMRAAIAALMARSKREIPHYYLTESVDLSVALAWMTERNRALPISQRLVPAALLLRAIALAARQHPELNGFWVDDAFVPGTGVHLGVAVSLRGGGLVAPALHDADTVGVEELMVRMRDLVTRARAGRLRGSEMSDPTLTVTNLGERGVESVTGVIYPPQVALVGIGRIVERPWAVDGMLTVRPVTTLTLAADHRATDGFSGSRLLSTITTLLTTPEEL